MKMTVIIASKNNLTDYRTMNENLHKCFHKLRFWVKFFIIWRLSSIFLQASGRDLNIVLGEVLDII